MHTFFDICVFLFFFFFFQTGTNRYFQMADIAGLHCGGGGKGEGVFIDDELRGGWSHSVRVWFVNERVYMCVYVIGCVCVL
jgi:hypothetical protein